MIGWRCEDPAVLKILICNSVVAHLDLSHAISGREQVSCSQNASHRRDNHFELGGVKFAPFYSHSFAKNLQRVKGNQPCGKAPNLNFEFIFGFRHTRVLLERVRSDLKNRQVLESVAILAENIRTHPSVDQALARVSRGVEGF